MSSRVVSVAPFAHGAPHGQVALLALRLRGEGFRWSLEAEALPSVGCQTCSAVQLSRYIHLGINPGDGSVCSGLAATGAPNGMFRPIADVLVVLCVGATPSAVCPRAPFVVAQSLARQGATTWRPGWAGLTFL